MASPFVRAVMVAVALHPKRNVGKASERPPHSTRCPSSEGQLCTWVGAFVYSHESDENIFVGALRFPGENLVLAGKLASFVEIYGQAISVEEIPKVTVTFGNLRVNGTPVEKPSATAVYPARVPDYAEAIAKDGQLVATVGKPVPDRKQRQVELLPVK